MEIGPKILYNSLYAGISPYSTFGFGKGAAAIAQVLTFVSGKGGVGKSSVAAAVAQALAAAEKKILIVDMDIGLKSLDVIFGIGDSVVYHWGDMIQGRCSRGDAVKRVGEVDILSAPLRPAAAFTREAVRKMIADCASAYDFILLDAPSGLGQNIDLAVCAATGAVIVATPDRISASAAGECAAGLRQLGIPTIRLIVNRFSARVIRKGFALNLDEMIDLCAARLIGVIPEDPAFAISTCNGLSFRQTDAYRAAQNVARRILGQEIPLKHLEKLGNN